MRQFTSLILLLFAIEGFISCSKTSAKESTVAAVNVINANVGSQGIIPNLWSSVPDIYYPFTYTINSQSISFGSVNEFPIVAGNTPLNIVQAIDTTTIVFQGTFNFKMDYIYSLFVAGSTTTPDTMLVQDNIPHLPYSDSTDGLRFVNLVQGESISIDYVGGSGNVASGLSYKGIIGFQQFPANSAEQATGYTFEFRDAESDSLLTTLQVTIMPNLCQTLIFGGSAAAGYSAFTENDF